MKNNRIKTILIFAFVGFSLSMIGCKSTDNAVETVPVDEALPVLDTLSGNTLTLSHDIENFKIKTVYDIGNYSFNKWRITDSKNIKMTANIESLEDGEEVLIEHVHADISIKSVAPQLDGTQQDSMDDTYHGVNQDGFLITTKYPYEDIFAIQGFSKDLIEGWSSYSNGIGNGEISSRRLTEKNLISQGTYGNKLQVVYNFLVKHKGEGKYHTKSIIDEVLIPIPEAMNSNSKEKNSQEHQTNKDNKGK
jgi:hypothetical protein